MTDSIVDPMTPEDLDPAPLGPVAGDTHDDDSQAYEAEFEAAPVPPIEYSGIPYKETEIKPNTRLVTRQVSVGLINGVIQDPIMLFPADPNRIALSFYGRSDAVRYLRFASEKTGCFDGVEFMTTATTVARSLTALEFNGHTGAVWVYSTADQEVIVSGVAVTR